MSDESFGSVVHNNPNLISGSPIGGRTSVSNYSDHYEGSEVAPQDRQRNDTPRIGWLPTAQAKTGKDAAREGNLSYLGHVVPLSARR